jgi:hypothetical protein
MRRGLSVFAGAVAVALSISAAAARTWTDTQGRTTEAEFVRIFNGNAVFQRGNQVVKVPFANLSADDQSFIRAELKRKGQEDLLPPAPAESPAGAAEPNNAAGDKPQSGERAKPKLPAAGAPRIWTDSDGRKLVAQFERWSGDPASAVTLRQGAMPLVVAFAKFSAADQDYLRKLVADGPPAANDIAAHATPRTMPSVNPPTMASIPRGRMGPPVFSPRVASAPPTTFTPPTYTPPGPVFQPTPPPKLSPPIFTPPPQVVSEPSRPYTPPTPKFAMVEVYHCSKCGHDFGTTPPALGSTCPQCGVTFGEVHHSDGRVDHKDGVSAVEWTHYIGRIICIVISVISMIAGGTYYSRR